MNHEFKLASGAVLKITESSFEIAEDLNDAIMEEGLSLNIQGGDEIDYNFFKNVGLKALSSKKIKGQIWRCIERASYNGAKITRDTFAPSEARGDYFEVLFHVAEVNVRPFTKNLIVQFQDLFQKAKALLPASE